MPKKVTTEDFIVRSRLVEKHRCRGYDYSKVVYISAHAKVEIICPEHGPFWQAATSHLQGSGCPSCVNLLPITNEIADSRLVGKSIKRIGNITNSHSRTLWRCLEPSCGYEWEAPTSATLTRGTCPKCVSHIRLTNAEVDRRIAGRTLERIGNISGNSNKTLWRCLVSSCEHEWFSIPASILQGYGCPKCANNAPLTNAAVDSRITGRELVRLGNVGKAGVKILWRCLKSECGNTWEASPNKIFSGRGCPACAKYGFNPSKESVVYVYNISETYCGYGISSKFEQRNSRHVKSFKDYGVSAKLVRVFKCSGEVAQKIERMIQLKFEIVDTGIPGFHREATHLSNLPDVLQFVEGTLAKT